MDKFIAKLNGVEYTDREEFYNAFRATKPEDIKSVSVHETTGDEETKKPEAIKEITEKDVTDFFNGLTEFFPTFDSLVNAFARLFSEAQKEPEKKAKEPEPKQEPEPKPKTEHKYTGKEIVEAFSFKETTYEFTGGPKDDAELEKFYSLLDKRITNFKLLSFYQLTEDEKMYIRCEFEKRVNELTKKHEYVHNEMKRLDESIAKYERLIGLMQELNISAYDAVERPYAEETLHFDINSKRIEYYKMLIEYYESLISILDTKF